MADQIAFIILLITVVGSIMLYATLMSEKDQTERTRVECVEL